LVKAVVDEVAVEEVAEDGGGGLVLRADTNKKQRCEGRGEASRFGLLNDVSQRIRIQAAHAACGHRRRTVTVRGVARARAQ
jgi:hypothetical protein